MRMDERAGRSLYWVNGFGCSCILVIALYFKTLLTIIRTDVERIFN